MSINFTPILDELAAMVDTTARMELIVGLRKQLHKLSALAAQPVDEVRWVSIDQVIANDYNPNAVARKEMSLLRTSIMHDGLTQPIVTIYDESLEKYVIVDGFHRYFTVKSDETLRERTHGLLPVVVIEKPANDRMASTIRHNRARGKHSVTGMSNMVFQMLENGWEDSAICNELGMEAEELLRLKHITGFSKLFADTEYRQAWVMKNQIRYAKEFGVDLTVSVDPKKGP